MYCEATIAPPFPFLHWPKFWSSTFSNTSWDWKLYKKSSSNSLNSTTFQQLFFANTFTNNEFIQLSLIIAFEMNFAAIVNSTDFYYRRHRTPPYFIEATLPLLLVKRKVFAASIAADWHYRWLCSAQGVYRRGTRCVFAGEWTQARWGSRASAAITLCSSGIPLCLTTAIFAASLYLFPWLFTWLNHFIFVPVKLLVTDIPPRWHCFIFIYLLTFYLLLQLPP